jgi:hypothetical protein
MILHDWGIILFEVAKTTNVVGQHCSATMTSGRVAGLFVSGLIEESADDVSARRLDPNDDTHRMGCDHLIETGLPWTSIRGDIGGPNTIGSPHRLQLRCNSRGKQLRSHWIKP